MRGLCLCGAHFFVESGVVNGLVGARFPFHKVSRVRGLHIPQLNAVFLLERLQFFADPFDLVILRRQLLLFGLKHRHHFKSEFDFVLLAYPNLNRLWNFLFWLSCFKSTNFRKPISLFLLRRSSLRLGKEFFVFYFEGHVPGEPRSFLDAS